ncbi:hypothetical protein HDK77DRAFT_487722 [Phyllosticta capitalensis]
MSSTAPGTTLATSTSSSAAATTSASSGSEATVAITTTFTPPSACTSSHLTMVSNFYVWINEPMPVPGSTFSSCYPTQWIADYSSVSGSLSSIAPLVTPLVCPVGWDTATSVSTGDFSGYFACCPSEYDLTPPDTAVDTDRPFYGGTCFSSFTAGNTYTMTKYDSTALSGNVTVTFTNGDAAYGHPIDGWVAGAAISRTTSTAAGGSSSGSVAASATGGASSSSSSAATGGDGGSSGLSGGAIAGIVIGCVAGVALLGLAAWAILRRHHKASASDDAAAAAANEEANEKDATSPGGATVMSNEMGGGEINELGGDSRQVHEVGADAKGTQGWQNALMVAHGPTSER